MYGIYIIFRILSNREILYPFSYIVLYLFTTELYPTRYRHSLLGFSSMIGRIGSIISPLTPPLMAYWNGIQSMMFETMAFISTLLVLTQPEIKGLKVPDTIEEAEQIGKRQNCLTTKNIKIILKRYLVNMVLTF